jgi:hypothetical protein
VLHGFFHREHNYYVCNCGRLGRGECARRSLHCLTDRALRGNGGLKVR